MSKHLVPHIKKLNPKDSPATNKTKSHNIGAKLSLSTNVPVAATGTGVTSGSGALNTAIDSNASIHVDAVNATRTMNTKNKDVCTTMNAAAVIMEQQFPNQPDVWRTYDFEVTMEDVADTVLPGFVLHGSVSQGDVLGTADVHHDPLAEADDYRVLVSKGAIADRSLYIDVTNTDESTSKSSTTVTLPSDYLNVPLNFILIAHNTAGDGPDSIPFGGGRRIQ